MGILHSSLVATAGPGRAEGSAEMSVQAGGVLRL